MTGPDTVRSMVLGRGMATRDPYVRAVTVVDVHDGDTFTADVDLGFHVRVRMACRLAGLNCAELGQPGGPQARAETARLLALGAVTVESIGVDKFSGRFDAVVVVTPAAGPRVVVNDALIGSGFAVAWDGAGPKPLVPWPRPGTA